MDILDMLTGLKLKILGSINLIFSSTKIFRELSTPYTIPLSCKYRSEFVTDERMTHRSFSENY